jgi:hypothetical protein
MLHGSSLSRSRPWARVDYTKTRITKEPRLTTHNPKQFIVKCGLLLCLAGALAAQTAKPPRFIPEDHRPPLFLRESFKETPKGTSETPVTADFLTNPNLELKLYGPGKGDIQIVHHESPKDEPSYIWTGLCSAPCALALRDKSNYVDLTSLAKIRWRSKQAGFHLLRPLVKLADGTWLVGDHADGYTVDWRETEMSVGDIHWRKFDPEHVTEGSDGRWAENPDLSKVDEIGFTDLTVGSGHGAGGSSRIDWIEVYGNPVPRPATQ